MEIFKLFGSIFVDNAKANESISKTEKHAEGLGSKLGAGIKTAAKWGAAIGAGAVAAGGALLAVANKAAETTDRIDKMSQKLGMTREGFQQWDFILSQNGASIDSLGAGMKTLTNQVDELGKGGKVATDAFGELGLSYEDLEGLSQEQIFEKTITALQGVEDETKRAAIANDLLGRSGQELAPLLNAGADSVEQMKQQAKDLGLVLSDDAVDAGVKFTDTMDQLKRSFGAVFTQVGTALMPIFQQLAEWIVEHIPQIKAIFSNTFEVVGKVFNTFKDIFTFGMGSIGTSTDNNFSLISELVNTLSERFSQFKEFFIGWVTDNQGTLLELKEIFMVAFQAIQGFISTFTQFTKMLWDKYGQDILSIIGKVLTLVVEVFKTAFKIVTDVFNIFSALFRGDWAALWEGIKQLISDVWNGIEGIVRKGLDVIRSIVHGAWNVLTDAFDYLWRSVSNWFDDLISDAIQWGKDVLTGLANGIKSAVFAPVNAIKDMASAVGGAVTDFFGIASPSKLMAEYGQYIDEGLAQGIEQNTGIIENAVDVMGNAVNSKLTDVLDTVGNIVSNIQDRITIGEGYFDIGNVRYDTNASNERYKKRKKSDWDKYGDEIDEVANRNNVDRSTAYDMWQQNKTDEMIGDIPKYAKGTNYHPGGLALVGEKGPELVNLKRGAEVKTADETRQLLGNKIENIFNISKLIVREEADIKKIARELHVMQRATTRGAGAY